MEYAALNNLERFDTYADIVGSYSRGSNGQFKATFRDFEMKQATPEIEAIINAFREKYEFVKVCTKWEYAEDNDELGTGSSYISFEYLEIGEDCVFLLFEEKVVGVAYPSFCGKPVVWFHAEDPGYHLHDDYAFHLKEK